MHGSTVPARAGATRLAAPGCSATCADGLFSRPINTDHVDFSRRARNRGGAALLRVCQRALQQHPRAKALVPSGNYWTAHASLCHRLRS